MKYAIHHVTDITTQASVRCLGVWWSWTRRFLHRIPTGCKALYHTLIIYHQRARQRRALAVLDDRLLNDINVSAEDAQREAHKPFWRP